MEVCDVENTRTKKSRKLHVKSVTTSEILVAAKQKKNV
jgi:hypothetical protein